MPANKRDKELLQKYLSERQEDVGKDDPELVEKILSTAGEWTAGSSHEVEDSLSKFKELVNDKEGTKRTPKVLPILYRIAAVLTIGFGLLFYFLNTKEIVTKSTLRGERSEISLPDGSKVYLDAESQITYDRKTWDEQREIELIGKAFFDVVEGKSFTVSSNSGLVKVLGTSFTIDDHPMKYLVSCYSGKVSVESGNTKEIITAGESAQTLNTKLVRIDETLQPLEWTSGILSFDRIELRQLFNEIERQLSIEINYSNPEELYYSGIIDVTDDSETIISKISKVMGLTVSSGNGIYTLE